jgi:Cu2+-exporting ATPase
MKTVTLPVKGLNFAGCAPEIEKSLGKQASIEKVEASYVTQTVTITYDETQLSEEQLRARVQDCGFACGGTPVGTTMASLDGGLPAQQTQHMQHSGGSTAPMTIPGTAPAPEAAEAPKAPDMSSDMQMDHRTRVAGSGMGGDMMGHDMSDPAMAKQMEADMRNRFFVSLVLTIPVVLYTPLGVNLFKLHLPTPFGISPNWVLLVLATPVRGALCAIVRSI